MAEYVNRLDLLASLCDGDAIGFKGLQIIKSIPNADVIERKQGMWIDANLNFLYKCS